MRALERMDHNHELSSRQIYFLSLAVIVGIILLGMFWNAVSNSNHDQRCYYNADCHHNTKHVPFKVYNFDQPYLDLAVEIHHFESILFRDCLTGKNIEQQTQQPSHFLQILIFPQKSEVISFD